LSVSSPQPVKSQKLLLLDVEELQDIRQPIELEDVTPEQKEAMLKDCHLIEAAIKTDMEIVSLDGYCAKTVCRLIS
jgi:hypothetical protein